MEANSQRAPRSAGAVESDADPRRRVGARRPGRPRGGDDAADRPGNRSRADVALPPRPQQGGSPRRSRRPRLRGDRSALPRRAVEGGDAPAGGLSPRGAGPPPVGDRPDGVEDASGRRRRWPTTTRSSRTCSAPASRRGQGRALPTSSTATSTGLPSRRRRCPSRRRRSWRRSVRRSSPATPVATRISRRPPKSSSLRASATAMNSSPAWTSSSTPSNAAADRSARLEDDDCRFAGSGGGVGVGVGGGAQVDQRAPEPLSISGLRRLAPSRHASLRPAA